MKYKLIKRYNKTKDNSSLLDNVEEQKDVIIILFKECPICLEVVKNNENYIKFDKCYHYFHIKCINDWREQNKINSLIYTCELCQIPRDILEFNEIVSNNNDNGNVITKFCNKAKRFFSSVSF